MKNNNIHISWNEITTACIKLFRGIKMDVGHAEEASIAISRMEAWFGTGLQYLHSTYNEISPTDNLGVKFVIKKPHLLVIEGNNQSVFKISEALDYIKAHTAKYGYVVSHIHNFKQENILPSLLYKNYVGDIQLSAKILSNDVLSIIQNLKSFNNPQISEYNLPKYMASKGMITIYGYDSKHFNFSDVEPTAIPNYVLSPKTLREKLMNVEINGLNVDEDTWKWVIEKSKKILVPESEKSKVQAG